jgi:hypothetical protein
VGCANWALLVLAWERLSKFTRAYLHWEAWELDLHQGCTVLPTWNPDPPPLPPELASLRERLAPYVPDEGDLTSPAAPFNGPTYGLLGKLNEFGRQGEMSQCHIEVGPRDYRALLVTGGMDKHWAEVLGIDGTLWKSRKQWLARWSTQPDFERFFYNCIGLNVLVGVRDTSGQRVFLFSERPPSLAVNPSTTVCTVDEGLRRMFGSRVFDQRSRTDPTPDFEKAVRRALEEEAALSNFLEEGSRPLLMSFGIAKNYGQPAALYYWPLEHDLGDVMERWHVAKDGFKEGCWIPVPATRDHLERFIDHQNRKGSPVTSWTIVMAACALDVERNVSRRRREGDDDK